MGKLIMINKIKTNNQGQIAVIVLLVSALLLTLGLSASKKSITDTKVNTDEELLKQAFNTAESGINNYVNQGTTTYNAGNGSSAVVTSTAIGGGTVLASEGQVAANTNQLFWLVNHNADGSIGSSYYSPNTDLTLKVDSSFTGAVKIDYYTVDASGKYAVSRSGYNFSGSVSTVTGFPSTASKSVTINTGTNNALLIVATPIGGLTSLTLTGPNNFPNQGEELTSVGSSSNNIKTQVKTRNIYQVPSFFLEAITAKNIIQ